MTKVFDVVDLTSEPCLKENGKNGSRMTKKSNHRNGSVKAFHLHPAWLSSKVEDFVQITQPLRPKPSRRKPPRLYTVDEVDSLCMQTTMDCGVERQSLPLSGECLSSRCREITFRCRYCRVAALDNERDRDDHQDRCALLHPELWKPTFGTVSLVRQEDEWRYDNHNNNTFHFQHGPQHEFDPEEHPDPETIVDVLGHSVERFVVTRHYDKAALSPTFSKTVPHFVGQIGIRCKACAGCGAFGKPGSYIFPKSTKHMVQVMWVLCLQHLDTCRALSEPDRSMYDHFRSRLSLDSATHELYWTELDDDVSTRRSGGILWRRTMPHPPNDTVLSVAI